jgi:lactose/L-arabinose transport system substrate-binding protein
MSHYKTSRREFLRLSTVGAGAMLLAACGAPQPEPAASAATAAPAASAATAAPAASEATAAPAASAETVTLNVFVHENHPFDLVKPLFEAKYPNVKLNMMKNNDMTVFRTTLAAGDTDPGSVPDIFWPEPFDVQQLGKTGALFDCTELIEKHKSEFSEGKIAECYISKTGKYASVPGAISLTGLYWRPDIWEKAGVQMPDDWTWDDFIPAAQKIKKDTGAYSLFLPTDGSQNASVLWTFILAQLGGSITNADGTKVTMDDDKGIAAMTLVKKIYDADIAINDGMFNETFLSACKAGKVAAFPMQDWYRQFGIGGSVKTPEEGLGKWRVALLPRAVKDGIRTANFGGANTASTKYTQHPTEVSAFLEFAHMTMEGSSAIAKFGNTPSYLPYLQGDEFLSLKAPIFGDQLYNQVWAEAIKQYPKQWYKLPVSSEATGEVDTKIPDILKGKVGIEEGLKAIGDTVRKLNERYQD